MSNEFTKQYAIRLPNGLLHAHSTGGWVALGSGVISYQENEDEERQPVVYDTLEDAEYAIKRFQSQAAHMGITEWLGRIESRVCSPFTDSSAEDAESSVQDLEKWLGEQQ